MGFFSIIPLLFITCLVRLGLAQVNTSFYGVTLAPHAPITKFDIAFIIPNASTNPLMAQEVQAFWPGLEPDPVSALYQQVITNQGGGPGEWYLLPFWCCAPPDEPKLILTVYPGDTITTLFRWNPPTQNWFDNWMLQPGDQGNAAGEASAGGGLITDGHFDTVYANSHFSPMEQALIIIELQGKGVWDFGEIIWLNTIVEAQTSSSDWCTGPWQIWASENMYDTDVRISEIKDGNLAGIWAGLQPVPELLQQVIGNEGPAGQSWYDNWLLTIGDEGHTAGEVPMGGGLIVGPYDGLYAANSNTSKPYAMLMVETQQGQWWDWGTIYWKDVLIEAQTQATDWCTGDWSGNVQNGWDKLIWNRTTPVATVDAVTNTMTCYIASIVFIGHG
ncbi:hypothetical protein BDZ45DRAFT_692161 [Acephala macrosclerotiorum]|nr:hypothetical protein BDZ45DRAFT_692161 [Acephala macrosclerotiorum]